MAPNISQSIVKLDHGHFGPEFNYVHRLIQNLNPVGEKGPKWILVVSLAVSTLKSTHFAILVECITIQVEVTSECGSSCICLNLFDLVQAKT